jgi:uncharacterized membrane protein
VARALRTIAALFFVTLTLAARDRWTELNIGPFYVTTDTDEAAARDTLTQLEQTRWVLGNLLESKDLRSLWPIRFLLTREATPTGAFALQNGQYLWLAAPNDRPPLAEVAGLLLDANTPRLPAEVESGLRALFSTLEAHGSRVTWGSAPAHPDLAWARMQLFATKFEYSASFHIFLTALRGGSTLAAAERNAFGKSSAELEAEAEANLAAGHWEAVAVSGRPLDPKRDFGVHSLDPVIANVYLADCYAAHDPGRAAAAYKTAIGAGGDAAALGYEGLASLDMQQHENPKVNLDNAIRAGSRSAPVYVDAAEGLSPAEALPLLRRAAQINDRWAEPIYQQAELAATPAEKEALLKQALQLDPRSTDHWIELAKLETAAGEGTAAQGSWLRAEDSAPNDAERDRVHQLRLSYEDERLAADEAARRRERDAAHLADQQAQQAEMARIHAAEQKANAAADQAAGAEKPSDVVSWDSLAGNKKLSGTLTRVDCLKSGWRLAVKDKTGAVTQLFLSKDSGAQLPCGTPSRTRRISLQYRAAIDDNLQTTGEVSSLTLQ